MSRKDRKFTETGLPWHVVEEAINREIEWLEGVIEQTSIDEVPGCDECPYTFRKMALLIITGKIKAKEFIAREGHDLWDDLTQKQGVKKSARHGGVWHRRMMDVLTEYFAKQGFEVIPEPFLSKGRADLGIYKDGHAHLFIEIGTTSAYKLWSIQRIVTKYAKRCGLPIKATPHTLRHCFATCLAEEAPNPAALQILLGHESLDTTTRYVHTSDKYAEETHRKYHPLAKPD